jgi:hypothetical protein
MHQSGTRYNRKHFVRPKSLLRILWAWFFGFVVLCALPSCAFVTSDCERFGNVLKEAGTFLCSVRSASSSSKITQGMTNRIDEYINLVSLAPESPDKQRILTELYVVRSDILTKP